jgi:hypothetical protein
MDRWTDRWIRGQIHSETDGRIDARMDGGMEGYTDTKTDAEMWLLGCSHKVVLLKKAEVITAPLCYNSVKRNNILFRSEGAAPDSIFLIVLITDAQFC